MFEYFCPKCRQLRLYAKDPEPFSGCGNCENKEGLIRGALGTLDKIALLKECPDD